jgi:hypothetical protein
MESLPRNVPGGIMKGLKPSYTVDMEPESSYATDTNWRYSTLALQLSCGVAAADVLRQEVCIKHALLNP